jgi:hypothetical protein
LSGRSSLSTLGHLAARIDPRTSWTGYLIAAGTLLSVGLAFSEPSASEGLGLSARLVFWLAHVASALVLFELAQLLFGRITLFDRLPPVFQVATVGAAGAFIFAVFNLLLLDRIAFPASNVLDPEPVTLAGLLQELRDSGATSVLFWVLLNCPRLIIIAKQRDMDVASEPTLDATRVPPATVGNPADVGTVLTDLLSRLPRRIGTEIVAISAELHYIRVYTPVGQALILMSFGRAVEALCVVPGHRIHRSHWVALAHVVSLESDGDRVDCRLETGLVLPVSRAYRKGLRAALAARQEQNMLQAARKLTSTSRPSVGLT